MNNWYGNNWGWNGGFGWGMNNWYGNNWGMNNWGWNGNYGWGMNFGFGLNNFGWNIGTETIGMEITGVSQ
jgi:hypothetical protein